MAAPNRQHNVRIAIPVGEAQVAYSPGYLAWEVKNLELTNEQTLRSVMGPCIYEPDRDGKGVQSVVKGTAGNSLGSGTPHGIFHASLRGGVDLLLVRVDQYLYKHAGWARGWEVIETGLSSEDRPTFPDQFCILGGRVIWTNGIDQARVISADGSVLPLGFTEIPGPPTADGPVNAHMSSISTSGKAATARFYPNAGGYSWHGHKGTVGDFLPGQQGSLLAGTWYYSVRFEDSFGNLSAPSLLSNPASVQSMSSSPLDAVDGSGSADPTTGKAGARIGWQPLADGAQGSGAEIDDLLRQFAVRTPKGPNHCVAVHIYCTPDTRHVDVTPRFMMRVPGRGPFTLPDDFADSDLGSEMSSGVPVPVFRVMCVHQGCLVVGNVPGDEGLVRRSEQGLGGTFPAEDWVYPDEGGAAITGLASHAGVLYAFTESAVFSLEVFGQPRPVAQGIGCSAPRSLRALPSGLLVWRSRDGWYGMGPDGAPALLTRLNDRMVRDDISSARAIRSVAVIDPETQEYLCFCPPSGGHQNTHGAVFDGQTWRRMELGLHLADVCQTQDWRQLVLGVGVEASRLPQVIETVENDGSVRDPFARIDTETSTRNEVFVLGRETTAWAPPAREWKYRSAWIRGDDLGTMPLNVRELYIGMYDGCDDEFTVTFYAEGSWKARVEPQQVKAIHVDMGSGLVDDIAGGAVIGTARVRDRRLYWRRVTVGLENVTTWAFELRAPYPVRINLAAFAFDMAEVTGGNLRSRIPGPRDT